MSDGEYLKRPSQTLTSLSSLRNSLRDLTRRRHSEPAERSKRSKRKEQKPKEKTKSSLAKKLGLSRYRNQVKPISPPSPMSSQSSDEEIQASAEELYNHPPESSKASGSKEVEEERNPSPKSVRFEEDDDPIEKIVCSSPEKSSDSPELLKMEHPLQMENPLSPEEPKSTKEILAELSKVSDPMAFEVPVNKIQETTASRPPRPLSLEGAQQGLALEKREHLYKILVIGELGAGKTSIIKRYVHQFFSQHYRATIGVDFALKVLNWDSSTVIRLQLWDIAGTGQERFGNMTRVYYKEAVGAFVVFDVTRVATFDAVLKWKQDLDSKVQLPDGSPIPCVLLANKCDQQKEGLVNSPNKMEEYCKDRGFAGWFETSAKENVNIEEAARFLVNKILQNDQILQAANNDQRDGDKFSLDGSKKGGNNSGNRESSRKGMCSSC